MKASALTRFAELIDPTKCRVESFPGLVAVFGGEISDDASKRHCSKRNVFLRWIKDHKNDLVPTLVVPENYRAWDGLGKYPDLLAFEQDLGYLTDAVIVFLEGPGSFAELGAFSQIDSLASKLIVVIASEHHQDDSFISLGPVRQLQKQQSNAVCVIPSQKAEELEKDIPLVLEKLENKKKRKRNSEALLPSSEQHRTLAILDLIDLFLASTREEIGNALKALDIEVTSNRLHQLLFLLDKVGLIKKIGYGDQNFYLPTKVGDQVLINYNSKSEPFDRTRWRTEVIHEIAAQGPRRRVCEIHFGQERFKQWTS